eukprot:UN2304
MSGMGLEPTSGLDPQAYILAVEFRLDRAQPKHFFPRVSLFLTNCLHCLGAEQYTVQGHPWVECSLLPFGAAHKSKRRRDLAFR